MKISEFALIQADMAKACADIAVGKNKDYASQEDAFQSFKIGSAIARLLGIDVQTPRGDALHCIIRKLQRLANLERKGTDTPVYESVKDSVRDLHVYLDLYWAMVAQDAENKAKRTI